MLRLDPKNEYALVNLQKLHEEQHQWTEAYDTRQRLTKLTDGTRSRRTRRFWRFSKTRSASRRCGARTTPKRSAASRRAIDLDARAVPAYLNLGDVRVAQGNESEAAAIWEQLIDVAPDRAYLAFDRLEALAVRTGSPDRFTRLCRRLIDENPQDWRARLALSRHLAASGRPQDALDLLFAALVQNPHALGIHQAIWRALGQLHHPASLVDRYSELTASRRLLSGSSCLHALPLPQHGAALAVSALPRLEYVRRRTDCAGAGHDRSGGMNRI